MILRKALFAAVEFERQVLAVAAVGGPSWLPGCPGLRFGELGRLGLRVAHSMQVAMCHGIRIDPLDMALWSWVCLPWYKRLWYWCVSAW